RDAAVATDGDGAAPAVLVGLERRVDAEVRPAGVGRENARVARARIATVEELDGNGSSGTGCDRRLELVRGRTRRVDVVVHDGRRRPGEAAVGRLRELHVHLPERRVPVLVGEVEVARIGGACREALGDSVPEPRVW